MTAGILTRRILSGPLRNIPDSRHRKSGTRMGKSLIFSGGIPGCGMVGRHVFWYDGAEHIPEHLPAVGCLLPEDHVFIVRHYFSICQIYFDQAYFGDVFFGVAKDVEGYEVAASYAVPDGFFEELHNGVMAFDRLAEDGHDPGVGCIVVGNGAVVFHHVGEVAGIAGRDGFFGGVEVGIGGGLGAGGARGQGQGQQQGGKVMFHDLFCAKVRRMGRVELYQSELDKNGKLIG
jgi:hypothetical protein